MAKKEKIEEIKENIVTQALDDLMSDRFAIYAKYVIQDRAIPDAKDGLKPVQRRIIYTMFKNGNTIDKPTKKCAKIVGDVMGRFHPHGDTSIYDALSRMSQTWTMSETYIDFQGNNGSIDGDSPAAYRYTEARLSKFAHLLVRNLDKETIEYTLNYSDEELEPIVLPSYVPNLFINGSEGIAVALATHIPPHSLKEMCLVTIEKLKNPNVSLDELLTILKGPDFPTGGVIYDDGNIKKMYETGRGKFDVASKYSIIENKDNNQIVVSEIPYGTNKKDIVYKIDLIRKNREIDGIIDVKDLSSGDDISIVIDLKKDIDPKIVVQYLFNKTNLKTSYAANIVAICENHPRTLGLIDYLDVYIKHLKSITRKALFYDLEKANDRLNIVDGLIKAVSIIDEVVHLIRNSKSKEDAKIKLIEEFKFNALQAEAILNIRLYKLSQTDIQVYLDEKKDLEKEIKYLQSILKNEDKFIQYIIDDLNNTINEFGRERRTEVVEKAEVISISKRDLIAKEDFYAVLTRDGYIKRSSIKSYKACEGQLPGVKEGDSIVLSQIISSLDYILAFTDKGNYIFIPAHEIYENKWKDEGKHINYLCNLPLNEYIIKAIVVSSFDINASICLISKNGQIKKTKVNEFFAQRYSKPIQCMKLMGNDEVSDVTLLNNNNNLLIITESGNATYFNEKEFSATGLKTSGVKAISTLKNSSLKAIIPLKTEEKYKLLFLTDKGMYRIYDTSNLKLTARLGATQTVFKSFKSDNHKLVYYEVIEDKNSDTSINGIYDNNISFSFIINDYHLTPIDKYCKKNIEEFADDRFIKAINLKNTFVVNSDFKVEKEEVKKEEVNDTSFEQISIFDNNGD